MPTINGVEYLYYLPPNMIDDRNHRLAFDQDQALLEAVHYQASQALESALGRTAPDPSDADAVEIYDNFIAARKQALIDAEYQLRAAREAKGQAEYGTYTTTDPDKPYINENDPDTFNFIEVSMGDPIDMPPVPSSSLTE